MKADDMARPTPYEGSVPAAEQAHYDAIREARGWSWATLADYFEKQTTDPASPRLAEWARSQADAKPAKAKRGAENATEKRG